MRLDHAARLDRLLARHDNIQQVSGAAGNGALIRKDQLLVVRHDADAVSEGAARWIVRREDGPDGVTVFHLRPRAQVDVCELSASLAGNTPHKRLNAGPNHVLTAAPHWSPGPFDDPTPSLVIPTPPAGAAGGGLTERPVTVAILDTGISAHPWFAERSWFADCAPDVMEVPDANADERLDSVAGHGTFIAGVVMQQAPDATIVVGRVLTGDGVTDEVTLLHGLSALNTQSQQSGRPIDVISLSLGCYTHDDKPSPALEHGFSLLNPDTVVVSCAGNAASQRPFWPAALKRVVAVASLDAAGDDRAPFSNYGWWVDACTLGDQVVSSFFTFDGLGPDGTTDFDGYATWSGTSFAAPRVAGAIAASMATHGTSAPHAAAHLLSGSHHVSMPDLGVVVDVPTSGAS